MPMSQPMPIWDCNKAAIIVTLVSSGKPPHVLLVAPATYVASADQGPLHKASKYLVRHIIEPLRKRKLGPNLTKSIERIDRAHLDRNYELAIKLWNAARPKGWPMLRVTSRIVGDIHPPTDDSDKA